LYIECGQMSGDPSHRQQIEFEDTVAQFFTDIERANEGAEIFLPNGLSFTRPLQDRRNSGFHYGEIWRLGLPTKTQWGEPYVGRVVLLTRRDAGGYDIHVANAGSPTARQWATNANVQGAIGVTGQITAPGRNFGCW